MLAQTALAVAIAKPYDVTTGLNASPIVTYGTQAALTVPPGGVGIQLTATRGGAAHDWACSNWQIAGSGDGTGVWFKPPPDARDEFYLGAVSNLWVSDVQYGLLCEGDTLVERTTFRDIHMARIGKCAIKLLAYAGAPGNVFDGVISIQDDGKNPANPNPVQNDGSCPLVWWSSLTGTRCGTLNLEGFQGVGFYSDGGGTALIDVLRVERWYPNGKPLIQYQGTCLHVRLLDLGGVKGSGTVDLVQEIPMGSTPSRVVIDQVCVDDPSRLSDATRKLAAARGWRIN